MKKLLFAVTLTVCFSVAITAENPSTTPSQQTKTTPAGKNIIYDSTSLYGAIAKSWGVEENGKILEVGMTIPEKSIENSPESKDTTTPYERHFLDLGKNVKNQTFFDHIEIDWNPAGHPPFVLFSAPHYDFHFFNIKRDEVDKIDCTNTKLPDSTKLPKNYKIVPPPNGECIPKMGFHSADITSPELAPPPNNKPFDALMIIGYYDAKLIFEEPMITKKYLQQKKNFSLPVPSIPSTDKISEYPSSFKASYNQKEKAWDFVWSNFRSNKK